jgi:hypothetical protein
MDDEIQVSIIVDVTRRQDIAAGKSYESHTRHTFNDVVSDQRLTDILVTCLPEVNSGDVSA